MQSSKIALAQIRPRKGDYDENLRRVGGAFAQLAGLDEVPDIVVFPETVMSGYFLQGGVSETGDWPSRSWNSRALWGAWPWNWLSK